MSTQPTDEQLLNRVVSTLTSISLIARLHAPGYDSDAERFAQIADLADALRGMIRAAHEQRADEADAQAQSDAQAVWVDEGGAVKDDQDQGGAR